MPKFLIKASYTAEGVRGIAAKGGTARKEAVEQALAGVGGKVESFYFAFGDHDAYVIADVPDNTTAAAVALTVNQTGVVAVKTDVLLTCEEVDEAAKQSVAYTPPGG